MNGSAAAPAKAPWHFWVIAIISLLWNAVGALDFTMTELKNEAYLKGFTPEQLAYFYGFPLWLILAWAAGVWGALAGSVLLLMRRRLAVPCFAVSLVGIVVTAIHNYALTDGMKIMGGVGPVIFSAVIFLIGVGLWLYSRALARTGLLR